MIFIWDDKYTTTYTVDKLREVCNNDCDKCKYSHKCGVLFNHDLPSKKQIDNAISKFVTDNKARRWITIKEE